MKCVVIGAVSSTKVLIEEIHKSNMDIDMIFSLDEKLESQTSGYYPLHKLAEELGLPYRKYIKINDKEHIECIKALEPDYIFAIGFSQLISRELINAAKIGVIGFHPTSLPKFRGRAAVVWQMLLGVKESKVSLFFINEQADAGPIIGQEVYFIDDNDYVIDVHKKIEEAEVKLIKKIIPLIENNEIEAVPQDDSKASYLLKRIPEDGIIFWDKTAKEIQLLIRATSSPARIRSRIIDEVLCSLNLWCDCMAFFISKCFSKMPEVRVSSAKIKSASFRMRMALKVISSRFPTGVGTT